MVKMIAMHWRILALLAMVLGFGFALAGSAMAEDTAAKKVAPSTLKNAPTIQELEEMKVEGKIQKPEVFYVLSRTEAHYKMPIRVEDFVDRIVKSVEKNPF